MIHYVIHYIRASHNIIFVFPQNFTNPSQIYSTIDGKRVREHPGAAESTSEATDRLLGLCIFPGVDPRTASIGS